MKARFRVDLKLHSWIPRACSVEADTVEEAVEKAKQQVDRAFGYTQTVEVVEVRQTPGGEETDT